VVEEEDSFLFRKMINKKGQVQAMAPAILALVFAAIVLVFGLVMTQELTDTQSGGVTATISANETLTLTGSGTTSAHVHAGDCGYASWTPTVVYNGTSHEILAVTTDYTVNAAGTLTNVTFMLSPVVTYTYTWGGEACNAANSTTYGLGTFADFWEIIVLAIVITVVIGLLLVVFGGRRSAR